MRIWKNPAQRALFVFLCAIIILILRRPDMILYPQLWAEDGLLWVASAHNIGAWQPLFIPVAGYFQTISRLAGAITVLFPLEWAPALFNATALMIRALPVALLFSNRYTRVVPSVEGKILLAAAYLLMPNSEEILANVTNAHTYLALLAIMTIVAPAPTTRAQKITDAVTYSISAVSGAFILFMYPIFAMLAWMSGVREVWKRYWVPITLGGVQVVSTALHWGARSSMELGATFALFLEITVKQVILGTFLGVNAALPIYGAVAEGNWFGWLAIVAISGTFLGLVVYGWREYPQELKIFILFAALAYAAALAKPMASFDMPQWQALAIPAAGIRYWFFPSLACMAIVIFHLQSKKPAKWAAYVLLLVWCYGAVTSFSLSPWPNLQYKEQIGAFRASTEAEYRIEIMPAGWFMPLQKTNRDTDHSVN